MEQRLAPFVLLMISVPLVFGFSEFESPRPRKVSVYDQEKKIDPSYSVDFGESTVLIKNKNKTDDNKHVLSEFFGSIGKQVQNLIKIVKTNAYSSEPIKEIQGKTVRKNTTDLNEERSNGGDLKNTGGKLFGEFYQKMDIKGPNSSDVRLQTPSCGRDNSQKISNSGDGSGIEVKMVHSADKGQMKEVEPPTSSINTTGQTYTTKNNASEKPNLSRKGRNIIKGRPTAASHKIQCCQDCIDSIGKKDFTLNPVQTIVCPSLGTNRVLSEENIDYGPAGAYSEMTEGDRSDGKEGELWVGPSAVLEDFTFKIINSKEYELTTEKNWKGTETAGKKSSAKSDFRPTTSSLFVKPMSKTGIMGIKNNPSLWNGTILISVKFIQEEDMPHN